MNIMAGAIACMVVKPTDGPYILGRPTPICSECHIPFRRFGNAISSLVLKFGAALVDPALLPGRAFLTGLLREESSLNTTP
jgi:hypothetical protein